MFYRQILSKIEPFLKTRDIILLYWARQVGKTSIMQIIQENEKRQNLFIDLEQSENLNLVNSNQERFVDYLKTQNWNWKDEIVVFIDEIQYAEDPTSFLKYLHDHYPIKFIVSWSSTLDIRWKLKNSMVWRMLIFEVYPLNFQEFLVFKWKDNLAKLVRKNIDLEIINDELSFLYKEYCIFWWYPQVVLTEDIESKKIYLRQIVNTYIQKDIRDIWKINDIEKFNKMLMVLADQSWQLLNISELAWDSIWVSRETLNKWLLLLENTFVTKQIRPFSKNVRSELTKMPKIFFEDNWIKNVFLNNFEVTWNWFETSIFNDLSHSYRFENIQFYRTKDKQEIDLILEWIPYEIKLTYNGKRLTALEFFQEKYGKKWNIITFDKKETNLYNVFSPREV